MPTVPPVADTIVRRVAKCNNPRALLPVSGRNSPKLGGTDFATLPSMLRSSCKVVLIASACLLAAAKLHGRGATSPVVTTQEVNRCLVLVRAAAGKSLEKSTGKRTRRPAIIDR